jgi:hypothetical protein
MHSKCDLRLFPVSAEMAFPDQYPKEEAERERVGRLNCHFCFTVMFHMEQNIIFPITISRHFNKNILKKCSKLNLSVKCFEKYHERKNAKKDSFLRILDPRNI